MDEAEVVLSFPVDEEDYPFLLVQYIFALFPLQHASLGVSCSSLDLSGVPLATSLPATANVHTCCYFFLSQTCISLLNTAQCDFVTQACRQGAFHSPWRDAFLDGVAEAFRDAALGSTSNEILQHSQLLYLPIQSTSGAFWSQLRPRIMESPQIAEIFGSWSRAASSRLCSCGLSKAISWVSLINLSLVTRMRHISRYIMGILRSP